MLIIAGFALRTIQVLLVKMQNPTADRLAGALGYVFP
jgi:hypothetical protein